MQPFRSICLTWKLKLIIFFFILYWKTNKQNKQSKNNEWLNMLNCRKKWHVVCSNWSTIMYGGTSATLCWKSTPGPTGWKRSMCISGYIYLLLPWRIPEKVAYDHCSWRHKNSIYCMKHMYIQPSSMEVDWLDIWRLMEVFTMFYICTYCVFTLGAEIFTLILAVKTISDGPSFRHCQHFDFYKLTYLDSRFFGQNLVQCWSTQPHYENMTLKITLKI